jgi:hypothetical protein
MQKKLLVMPVVLLLFACTVNAQLVKSYGFKVAVTSAFQKFDYSPLGGISNSDIPWKRKTCINAGLFIEWLNLPIVSVITQLDYRQVGVGAPVGFYDTVGNILSSSILYGKVNYISMPLLLKAELPTTIVCPYLLLGSRIDHLISYSSDRDFWSPVYKQFEKTVYGGTFGIGLETKHILPVTAILEFRYNMDFTDSYSDEYLKIKNNSYDFCLGIGF